MNSEYENLIKDVFLKLFSRFYLIDVSEDKVFFLKNTVDSFAVEKIVTFFDFMQELTEKLETNDLNDYFDNISLKKLEANNGIIVFESSLKNSSGELKKHINISTILNDGNDKKVLITNLEFDSVNKNELELKELKERLSLISNYVSDVILKLYNTIDISIENTSTKNYISNLLDNLVNDFPEFNNQFKKDITSQVNKTKNTLLVADDDLITRNLIKKTFSDEFDIVYASNGKEAIDILEKMGIDNIVGMFLDLMMPIVDGFAVLDYLKEQNILSKIPIIIISGTEDKATRQRVYQYNIADLLEKPFNLEVIKYRTKNLIKLYKTSNSLNNMVTQQYSDLMSVIDEIVHSYEHDHSKRINHIKKYLEVIMKDLKEKHPKYNISDFVIKKVVESVNYYDIGLYVIPRNINYGPNIEQDEIELIRKYPKYSKIILEKYLTKYKDDELLRFSTQIAELHQEKYDGSGYPYGLKGNDIPIWVQCVTISILLERILSKNVDGLVDKTVVDKYFKNKYNPDLVQLLPDVLDKII